MPQKYRIRKGDSNIIGQNEASSSLEENLSEALRRLESVGGTEAGKECNYVDDDDDGDDDTDDDGEVDNNDEQLMELLAVADARYELGQYDKAAWLYFRSFFIALRTSPTKIINDPTTFPIVHQMIQSSIKSDDEYWIKQAYVMAKDTCMLYGHPLYIEEDLKDVEKIMMKKGMQKIQ